MPIQPKCGKCKRKGGYTSEVDSGLCQRCINKEERENGENEEENGEEEDEE